MCFSLEEWFSLPPARPGKVYALKVYPGGRRKFARLRPACRLARLRRCVICAMANPFMCAAKMQSEC